jgi:2-oxoglutarate ferredoxin oxidoreductase subunit gamma
MEDQIIITGFGGQGVVLAGKIVGKAAAIGDKKQSTLVQSYGPESRGGACSAQVIISTESIHFPYVRTPGILVCMSQSGYEKYISDLAAEAILISDQDLVKPAERTGPAFCIPATRFAEELGRKMMANIIMVGFFTAVTGIISLEAARKTVSESVPKGTEEMNLKAFAKGCDFGLALLKARRNRAAGRIGVSQ